MMNMLKNLFLSLVLLGSVSWISFPSSGLAQWKDPSGMTGGYFNASPLNTGLPGGTIYGIISITLKWLLAILGFIAIIGFVIAGILYFTAAGDEDRAEQAKNAFKYSIIGVIVALVGFVIVRAVDTWLTGLTSVF